MSLGVDEGFGELVRRYVRLDQLFAGIRSTLGFFCPAFFFDFFRLAMFRIGEPHFPAAWWPCGDRCLGSAMRRISRHLKRTWKCGHGPTMV